MYICWIQHIFLFMINFSNCNINKLIGEYLMQYTLLILQFLNIDLVLTDVGLYYFVHNLSWSQYPLMQTMDFCLEPNVHVWNFQVYVCIHQCLLFKKYDGLVYMLAGVPLAHQDEGLGAKGFMGYGTGFFVTVTNIVTVTKKLQLWVSIWRDSSPLSCKDLLAKPKCQRHHSTTHAQTMLCSLYFQAMG